MRWDYVKAVTILCLSAASATFWPGHDGDVVARIFKTQPIHARQTDGTDLTVTTNGMCGNGTTCLGSTTYGKCCSYYYYCGNGDDFCGDNCRTEFGECGEDVSPPASTSPTTTSTGPNPTDLTVTTDGMCGNGTTCLGSTTYGRCCSHYYWCGNGDNFCGDDCRSGFGWCEGEPEPGTTSAPTTTTTTSSNSTSTTTSTTTPTTTTSTTTPSTSTTTTPSTTTTTTTPTTTSSTTTSTTTPTTTSTTTTNTTSTTSTSVTSTQPTPTGELTITTNGMCGNGTTCEGSTYGGCCSLYYWCGTGGDFCSDGCRKGFGECGEDASPPALTITTNGACGNGTTCAGSEFGDCCSDFYYCGTGDAWCGTRCRPQFGSCA